MENAVLRRAARQCIGATLKVLELFEKFRPISSLRDTSSGGNGGEGGIRTHGTLARTTVFETAPIDHSGTSPRTRRGSPSAPWSGGSIAEVRRPHKYRAARPATFSPPVPPGPPEARGRGDGEESDPTPRGRAAGTRRKSRFARLFLDTDPTGRYEPGAA